MWWARDYGPKSVQFPIVDAKDSLRIIRAFVTMLLNEGI